MQEEGGRERERERESEWIDLAGQEQVKRRDVSVRGEIEEKKEEMREWEMRKRTLSYQCLLVTTW